MRWRDFVTDPSNLPLPKPGVYLLENLINGKHYVGISQNVAKRLSAHARIGTKGRLPSAIRKHGHKNFRATPLYYSLCGTEYLEKIEAMMIIEFNSIDHGYNTIAANGGVGPYGDAYAAVHRARWSVPGNKDLFLSLMMEGRKTPQALANQSRASSEVKNRPHIKAAYSELMAKLRWINNGVESKRIEPDDPVPEGWRYGRITDPFLTEEYTSSQRAMCQRVWSDPEFRTRETERRLSVWENMPKENRKAHSEAIRAAKMDPEARQRNSATVSNLVWITDGTSNSRIPRETSIPNGWKLGRTSKSRATAQMDILNT